eukprot:scaffold67160_cov28-Tisochrysis_lutea.AAC.6
MTSPASPPLRISFAMMRVVAPLDTRTLARPWPKKILPASSPAAPLWHRAPPASLASRTVFRSTCGAVPCPEISSCTGAACPQSSLPRASPRAPSLNTNAGPRPQLSRFASRSAEAPSVTRIPASALSSTVLRMSRAPARASVSIAMASAVTAAAAAAAFSSSPSSQTGSGHEQGDDSGPKAAAAAAALAGSRCRFLCAAHAAARNTLASSMLHSPLPDGPAPAGGGAGPKTTSSTSSPSSSVSPSPGAVEPIHSGEDHTLLATPEAAIGWSRARPLTRIPSAEPPETTFPSRWGRAASTRTPGPPLPCILLSLRTGAAPSSTYTPAPPLLRIEHRSSSGPTTDAPGA